MNAQTGLQTTSSRLTRQTLSTAVRTNARGVFVRTLSMLGGIALLSGCGGGSNVAISVTPVATQILDAGQSLAMQATVTGDSSYAGISWTVNGAGQLSGASLLPVTSNSNTTIANNTYYAPAVVTGSSTVKVVVASVANANKAATVTIQLNPALVATSTVTTLPSGTVAATYSDTPLTATGGSGTLVYTVSSGALPAGLTLNAATGLVSGTPTAVGNSTFTITVTDSATSAASVSQAFTLAVISNISITTGAALPGGFVNSPYSQQLTTTGGSGAGYLYSLAAGSLPKGLTLSTGGLLAGSPTATGTFSPSIKVIDSAGDTVTKAFTLSISTTQLALTPLTLPTGNTGVTYSQQLLYNGGPGGTPAFSISSGALPPGITLASNGLLSGSPTTPGTYTFSATVTVGAVTSAAQSYTIITSNISINAASTASGEVALPFSFPEKVSGGTAPYTWTIAAGSNALPSGLVLSATTGLISGTPTSAGSTSITVRVTDSLGTTTTQTIAITISAARGSANTGQFVGQYAFLLSGFDASNNPITWVGKLTADGAGNISGGTVDINGTALTAPLAGQSLLASSYNVGSDNRGRLTLTTASGAFTFVLALTKPVSGVSTTGFLTETDSSGQSLTGRIALEDATAFNLPALTGGYAFGISGFLGSGTVHAGTIGQLQFTGAGSVTAELISSTLTPAPVAATSGAYTVSATGRGTVTLNLSAGAPVSLVFYVVSAKQLFIASAGGASGASATALLSGQAMVQTSGGFTAAMLTGNSISRTSRLTPVTSGSTTTYAPDVRLGILAFNGSSTASFSGDENIAGVASKPSLVGAYSVASNGRVTAYLETGFGGCENCASAATFLYLSAPDQGFSLDFLPGTGTGTIEPQASATSTAATLSGAYVSGTVGPLTQASVFGVAAISSTGTGTLTETEDQNINGLVISDKSISASYSATANGRVSVNPSDSTQPVLYLVSPTHSLQLELTTKNPLISEVYQ